MQIGECNDSKANAGKPPSEGQALLEHALCSGRLMSRPDDPFSEKKPDKGNPLDDFVCSESSGISTKNKDQVLEPNIHTAFRDVACHNSYWEEGEKETSGCSDTNRGRPSH
jgi:hypothetical protein